MSPRTHKQNEARREETRRRLLEAAVALFARNGFDGTGTADIARNTGVSHGTLFTYFPTKEDLFRTAVLTPLSATIPLIEQLTKASAGPSERVEALVRTMLISFAREEAYLSLVQ